MKKLWSVKGQWEVRKYVLGWMVYGATWYINLAWYTQAAIDAVLYNIVRMKKGVPFKKI